MDRTQEGVGGAALASGAILGRLVIGRGCWVRGVGAALPGATLARVVGWGK